jgi:SHS2 domain-containing protein
VHLSLNSIYFSKSEEIHQHNKRAAIRHLDFLDKKLQFIDNELTNSIFNRLFGNFPKNQPFDLVYYLVNPLIFIQVLHEFGFLEYFPELDPFSSKFNFDQALTKINGFFLDTDTLENLIYQYLQNGGEVPLKMKILLDDLESDVEKISNLPKYFKSMIFSAVESSTSFLSSLIYIIYTKYSGLSTNETLKNQLYEIANEVLRIYTPVPFVYRTVRENYSYNGVSLTAGDLVVLFLGTANMDESVFEQPTEIRANRKEKHLSFGKGQYACIGQFASFRITLNVVSNLMLCGEDIQFLDKNAKHFIQNSMLKIPLIVILNDKQK